MLRTPGYGTEDDPGNEGEGSLPSAFALAAGIGGTAGGLHAAGAHAASPNQLPFQCFNTAHTFHQTFGPNSFFTAENVQGPTSFQDSGPIPAPTVTLPLYTGTANGHAVYYVITDASDLSTAQALGVNYSPKLNSALLGAGAVQQSSSSDPTALDVPADVDFSPQHVLVPGPHGFPPLAAAPGSVANQGYSPLVELPDGVVINAPQIGDGTTLNGSDKRHWADKVVSVNARDGSVTYSETNGCYEDQSVHYISTDASDAPAAAIEDVTYAPLFGNVPSQDCGANDVNVNNDPSTSGCAREGLIAFINGQNGRGNVQRQGLNAAILDRYSPLNILEDAPNDDAQFNYSPVWDIHLVQWNSSVPLSSRLRQTDFDRAEALVAPDGEAQSITADGWPSSTFQGSGFVVDCPLISIYANN